MTPRDTSASATNRVRHERKRGRHGPAAERRQRSRRAATRGACSHVLARRYRRVGTARAAIEASHAAAVTLVCARRRRREMLRVPDTQPVPGEVEQRVITDCQQASEMIGRHQQSLFVQTFILETSIAFARAALPTKQYLAVEVQRVALPNRQQSSQTVWVHLSSSLPPPHVCRPPSSDPRTSL